MIEGALWLYHTTDYGSY